MSERATGKRAIDSYQRFQGKGGTAREGNETLLQLCDWLPALLENGPYCTLPFCTVILRPAPVDFLRDFRCSHLRFGPKLAGKKPDFFLGMSLQSFPRLLIQNFVAFILFSSSCTPRSYPQEPRQLLAVWKSTVPVQYAAYATAWITVVCGFNRLMVK